MDFQISPANISDLKAILDLQKDCYKSEADIYNDYEIPPLKQDIESIENEFKTSTILKGLVNGQIVASVRGFSDNDTCLIGKLIVKTGFQNMGLGHKMMDSIELVYKDCKRFELFTGHKSLKNLHLYNKQGYNEFKREVVNNNMTMIYMEKQK